MTPEGKVKAKVKAHLKKVGCYFEMPVPSGYGKSGLDFVGCYRGFYFQIEAKAEGNEPTPRQRATILDIQRAGGGAGWGHDADAIIESFEEWRTAVDQIVRVVEKDTQTFFLKRVIGRPA
jgi:hypothetical protein